jgi:hypothetical protein
MTAAPSWRALISFYLQDFWYNVVRRTIRKLVVNGRR